jgi:HNH endonuclease
MKGSRHAKDRCECGNEKDRRSAVCIDCKALKYKKTPTRCLQPQCERWSDTRGLCKKHYVEQLRTGETEPIYFKNQGKTCSVEKCGKGSHRKGLCNSHYTKLRRYGDTSVSLRMDRKPHVCVLEGCDETKVVGRGYCGIHYQRLMKNGDPGPAERTRGRRGDGWLQQGYRIFGLNGQRIAEHRLAVESILGRSLRDFEHIHHKNGIRSDNRPENLELWTVPQQPYGQRVNDLVAWVIENYLTEIEVAIKKKDNQ